jgi:hypothetical protein
MYRQDLPSLYLYVEKILEEEVAADSNSHGYEARTINLWDTGTYITISPSSSSSTTTTLTEQIRSGKVELFLAGSKL